MRIFNEDLALCELAKYQDTGIMSEELGHEIHRLARAIILSAYKERPDCEDIIAECTVAAVAACERFNPEISRHLHKYLSRTISNKAIDVFRKHRNIPLEDELLEYMAGKPYNQLDLQASENYASAEAECIELMLYRFWPYNADDVAHAFDVVYNIAIPTDLRGGRRRAISIIRSDTDFSQKEAILVYYAILFSLRLAVFNLLKHAYIAEYTRPKESLVLTLTPEFAVAYGINELSTAIMLLQGLSIKL